MNLLPRRLGLVDLFDDVFNTPTMFNTNDNMLRCDAKKKDGNYELKINVPGCKKEDVSLELEDGYLLVKASYNNENDEKDDDGHYVFRERSCGSFSRSFYVGDSIKEEDITANMNDGVLYITFPEKKNEEIETKKHIMIQ